MEQNQKKKLRPSVWMFLKQIRFLNLVLTSGAAAFLCGFWYIKRMGEPFPCVSG